MMSALDPRRLWRRLRSALGRRVLRLRLKKADVILASPRLSRLSPTALLYRVLLGSRYVHSMLYIGGGRMIHTTARHGVTVGRMPHKVHEGDRYTVYRADGLGAQQREDIVAAARRQLDRKLDHAALITNIPSRWFGLHHPLWRLEAGRVWCSRLIAEAYRTGADVDLVPPERIGTITTEDLSRSSVLRRL